MDRDSAIGLLTALKEAEPALDRLGAIPKGISDEAKRRTALRSIGQILSSHLHLTMAVVAQHRDLDPDRGDDSSTTVPSLDDPLAPTELLARAKIDLNKIRANCRRLDLEEQTKLLVHVSTMADLYEKLERLL